MRMLPSRRSLSTRAFGRSGGPARWSAILIAAALLLTVAAPSASAASKAGTLLSSWRTTHTASVLQETGTGVTRSGTWSTLLHTYYLGDAAKNSKVRNASAGLTFTGTGIAWVGALGPNRGRARVYIDGTAVAIIDARASTVQRGRVLFSQTWSTVATRTIRIVNLGTTGRPNVTLDAFMVRGKPLDTGSGGGSGMPTGNLPGWRLTFSDDFTTNVASGRWPSAVSSRWSAYGPGWKDTSGHGVYSPDIITQHDGLLDAYLHTSGGVHKVAAMVPILPSGAKDQLYGRYAVRFRADGVPGYKAAWMLWPKSNVWPRDGEIDWPEGDLDDIMNAFMHRQGATIGSDQAAFRTSARFTSWHTAVLEWSPSAVRFLLDGNVVGTATSRIPNTPMHLVLQNETALDSTPSDSASGHVLIDWVAIWSYAP